MDHPSHLGTIIQN